MFIFKWVRSIKAQEGIENKRVVWYTTSSQEDIKAILSNFSITIISFWEWKKTEWNLYEFWIKYDDKSVNIIISMEWKIREAFRIFINDFWIQDIDYVKPHGSDIWEEKLKIILDKLKKELIEEKNKKNGKNKSKSKSSVNEEKVSNFDKKKLEDFKKEVNEFIKEIQDFLPKWKAIKPSIAFELENAIWDLLKYRATTNIFKIAEQYKKALELSEKLYNVYYDYKNKEEKNKITDNIISNIDIIKEYKQYEKVQRVKTIESVDSKEFKFPWYEVFYYKIFWKYWVNLKLFMKELVGKYKLNYFWFEGILKFIQFVILFLIIEYSLFLIYKLYLHSPESQILSVYYMILNIAIIWFIITFWKMLVKKLWIFTSIIIMIVLYILFSYIKTFFWL